MIKYVYHVMSYNIFCEPIRVQHTPSFLSEEQAWEYLEKNKYSAYLPGLEYLWVEKVEYPYPRKKDGELKNKEY